MLNLGTLPENGTICPLEQSIEEAWGFELEPVSDSGSRALKLGLGMGLGLGVPALIASIIAFRIVRAGSKKQTKNIQELETIKRAAFK